MKGAPAKPMRGTFSSFRRSRIASRDGGVVGPRPFPHDGGLGLGSVLVRVVDDQHVGAVTQDGLIDAAGADAAAAGRLPVSFRPLRSRERDAFGLGEGHDLRALVPRQIGAVGQEDDPKARVCAEPLHDRGLDRVGLASSRRDAPGRAQTAMGRSLEPVDELVKLLGPLVAVPHPPVDGRHVVEQRADVARTVVGRAALVELPTQPTEAAYLPNDPVVHRAAPRVEPAWDREASRRPGRSRAWFRPREARRSARAPRGACSGRRGPTHRQAVEAARRGAREGARRRRPGAPSCARSIG